MKRQALQILPTWILGAKANWEEEEVCEIRLTIGQRPTIVRQNQLVVLGEKAVGSEDIDQILYRASEYSVFRFDEQLKNGFITLPDGDRIGICGRGVYCNGQLQSIKEIQSLCIRFAAQGHRYYTPLCRQLLQQPYKSTLIIGPPCTGKTTLLREIGQAMSYQHKTLIADERGELAAVRSGCTGYTYGPGAFVYSDMQKSTAVLLGVRSMSPQILILDEIGDKSDVSAIQTACYCGVGVYCSIHGENNLNYRHKEHLQNCFERYIVMDNLFAARIVT